MSPTVAAPPIPHYFDLLSLSQARALNVTEGPLCYCRRVDIVEGLLFDPAEEADDIFVGYDPGSRNAGLAILENGRRLTVYQIVWGDMSGPEEEMHYAMNVVKHLVGGARKLFARPNQAVVENASHGAGFGQADLANNRAAAVIGLWEAGYKVKLAAPSTITKQVLKHGRRQAKAEWKHLFGEDGATAVACVLLAAGLDK